MAIKVYSKIKNKLSQAYIDHANAEKARGKVKYFCIGRNKTGTTSLKQAFIDLDYPVGNQRTAELLADKYYFKGEFDPIIKYCRTAQVFQDVPFSWAETFKRVDAAYPGSKFILTVRDSAEQWYESITRYHAKLFGNGQIPTAEDLRNAGYVRKGFMYRAVRQHGAPDDDIYNKEILMAHYDRHNQEVRNYFQDRPEDLLVINISEDGSYRRFVEFIGAESPFNDFPWENKT